MFEDNSLYLVNFEKKQEVNMKTHYFFRMLCALCLAFLFKFPSVNAQQSSAPSTGILPGPLTMDIHIPPSKSAGRSLSGGIQLHSNDAPVYFSVITSSDPNAPYLQATLPAGTPLSSSIIITGEDFPLLHVTVADILGNAQNDYSDVIIRPVGYADSFQDYSNSVSTPGGPGSGFSQLSGTIPQVDVSVYPNPANSHITIVTEGEILWGAVEIMDITGKKVGEIPTGSTSRMGGADRVTLSLEGIKEGIYLFRFKTGRDTYTRKVHVIR
jgi:hypothetical protein